MDKKLKLLDEEIQNKAVYTAYALLEKIIKEN